MRATSHRVQHAVSGKRNAGDADGRLRGKASGTSAAPLRMTALAGLLDGELKGKKETLVRRFFIHRPVFATVCALLIILAGAVCIPNLPVAHVSHRSRLRQVSVRDQLCGRPTPIRSRKPSPFRWKRPSTASRELRYISSSSTNSGTSFHYHDVSKTGLRPGPSAAGRRAESAWPSVQGRLPRPSNATGITITNLF